MKVAPRPRSKAVRLWGPSWPSRAPTWLQHETFLPSFRWGEFKQKNGIKTHHLVCCVEVARFSGFRDVFPSYPNFRYSLFLPDFPSRSTVTNHIPQFPKHPHRAHGSWDCTNANWPKWFLGSLVEQKFPGTTWQQKNCDITTPSRPNRCMFFWGGKNLCYFSETKTSSAAMVPPSGASGGSSCDTTWLLSGK